MNRSIIQTRSKSDKSKEATELDEGDPWTEVSDLRSEHYPLSMTSAVSPEAEVPADPMALLQNAMATMITSMNQERKDRMSAAIEHAKEEKQRNDQLMKLAEENAAFHKLIEEHQHIDESAREAEQRKKAALQVLHKMDEHIDPEAYMQNFEQTLTEGELPEREWNNILRKRVSGKVLEAFRELDLTILYQTLKTSLLERLGCTDTRARKTIWRNAPTDNLSPRHHLTPIMKSINRLTARMESKKDFAMEMFGGALTLYYSPETCHAVRSNSYKNTQDIINELEATWESKSFHDRSKMHRRQAERQHFNGRKMSYNSREQTSTNGSGGCLTKGKDGWGPY